MKRRRILFVAIVAGIAVAATACVLDQQQPAFYGPNNTLLVGGSQQ
jgi:hypothetical protein